MSTNHTHPAHRKPKLYQNDIVHVPKVSSGDSYAVVLRCWHEPEDIPPQAVQADPLLRPLQQGEVGISYISHAEAREIIDESELVLLDRCLQPGDYCKRSVDDVRSGVVTSVKVKAKLAHVISGEEVEGWKVTEDLVEKQGAEVGDYVVYNDWIGQIVEVFDESIVEVANGGGLVRLPEIGSRLASGDQGTNILPPTAYPSTMANTFISFFGNRGSGLDRVINVKHTAYAVAWLALNQTLDVADAASRTRPPRFWAGNDISNLVLVRGRADVEMRVGDRVHLKDAVGLPLTEHGNEKDPAGRLSVQTFKVKKTVTVIEVLWQDGVRETLNSTDVIPYVSPDEYDCWPGDHVLWKAENQQRFAVVQSVNPTQRTAVLLFRDTNEKELVSLLELDPNGTVDGSTQYGPYDALGVRRGDFVFIHAEGSTNGMKPPKVPHIGEVEHWVREIPMHHGKLSGWRKEFEKLGSELAATRTSAEVFEGAIKRPALGDTSLYWIGEVSELMPDGTVEVTHPDWTTSVYPLDRLTRLYDSMNQLEDDPWLDNGSLEDEEQYDDEYAQWTMDDQGQWQEHYDYSEDHDWIDDEGSIEGIHGPNCTCAHDHGDDDAYLSADDSAQTPPTLNPELESLTLSTAEPEVQDAVPMASPSTPVLEAGILEDSEEWQRFAILPNAPEDHSFYLTVSSQPSRNFMARLTKEYKALSSGLPDSIIVRAYEDRADLLRCLIIGPANTPYQDAPFVIDWMLDSNFPHSPPLAHFLSWTNGNGRVNPNLYEDGKVCLSILGTWVGDQNETWSATRSSLLQAFVSIQGLVLVKEPWFCEPAYDKLRGTEEAIVNSRLYNEKAYVLSRGFIRRALELPPQSLENEITWLYHTKGCLRKALQESRALVEKSRHGQEISPEEYDLAIPRLTAGGIITLERTLQKLQEIYDRTQSSSTA